MVAEIPEWIRRLRYGHSTQPLIGTDDYPKDRPRQFNVTNLSTDQLAPTLDETLPAKLPARPAETGRNSDTDEEGFVIVPRSESADENSGGCGGSTLRGPESEGGRTMPKDVTAVAKPPPPPVHAPPVILDRNNAVILAAPNLTDEAVSRHNGNQYHSNILEWRNNIGGLRFAAAHPDDNAVGNSFGCRGSGPGSLLSEESFGRDIVPVTTHDAFARDIVGVGGRFHEQASGPLVFAEYLDLFEGAE